MLNRALVFIHRVWDAPYLNCLWKNFIDNEDVEDAT
jgi:hypothetical protein